MHPRSPTVYDQKNCQQPHTFKTTELVFWAGCTQWNPHTFSTQHCASSSSPYSTTIQDTEQGAWPPTVRTCFIFLLGDCLLLVSKYIVHFFCLTSSGQCSVCVVGLVTEGSSLRISAGDQAKISDLARRKFIRWVHTWPDWSDLIWTFIELGIFFQSWCRMLRAF